MRMESSALASYATISAVSLSLGYWIGARFASNPPPIILAPAGPSTRDDTDPEQISDPAGAEGNESESESEDDAWADGDLSSIKAGMLEECKLILVVRSDLGMTKGKIAAQCGHATLACYKTLQKTNPDLLRHWERTGQAKIALRCDSEEEMMLLQATAQSMNLCARSIRDAGRTQIAAGSQTVLGIGPGPVRLVNQVTGKLKLL